MTLQKSNINDLKEIKRIINENIASTFKTQRQFSRLLIFNGCPRAKIGFVGTRIRKQLLNEAKNGDLTPDNVMQRAYELIGEILEISDVKTFEDMAFENAKNEVTSEKKVDKKLNQQQKIEKKFDVDLSNKQWFKCSIEEIKYSTITNQKQRNVDTAYVIINNDNFEIIKESYFLKSKMGTRKLYFDNIASVDFDARGRLHASSSVILNTKSAEHVQLKFVTKENFELMNNAYESYIEKSHNIPQNNSTNSIADELLKYADLYERGLLTKEEFDMKKAELMGNPIANKTQISNDNNTLNEENIGKRGFDVENKPKFCSKCGTPIEGDINFCMNCGNKL